MLLIEIPVDPASVSVNIRYNSNSTIPPGVRKEMDKIVEVAEKKAKQEGWELGPTDYLDIQFLFYFENWRPDLDNPLKRSLDALSEALDFNDNRVVELSLSRRIDPVTPHMVILVDIIPIEDVPSPPQMKRKNADPVWVSEEDNA